MYCTIVFPNDATVYFEIYGCQMNVNDSDVVWSILKSNGYKRSHHLETADIVLLVTCAIRDGAEEKVWNKLDYLKSIKNKRGSEKHAMKIGILGERLSLFFQTVSLVLRHGFNNYSRVDGAFQDAWPKG